MERKPWTITSAKFLSEAQIKQLLEHITKGRDLALARGNSPQRVKDYYIVRTLIETGLRVAEFCAAKNQDFHGLKLVVPSGKGAKPRTVILTRKTGSLLKEWIQIKKKYNWDSEALFPSRYGSHYTTRAIQKAIKRIFASCDLPRHFSCHSLRHTYCSMLLATGKVGLATVKENMGHHSISVTDLYSHAIADLAEIELYPSSSSEKVEKCELETKTSAKKPKDIVKQILRNTNLRNVSHKRRKP